LELRFCGSYELAPFALTPTMVKQMVIIPLEKTNRFDPSSHFSSLSYGTEQRGEARWMKDHSQ
jgi:hypothetical protein